MLFKSTDNNDSQTVSLLESLINPLPAPNQLWIPAADLPKIFNGSSLTFEQTLNKVASVFLEDTSVDIDQLCKRTIRSSSPTISRNSGKVLVDLCRGPCSTSADLSGRFIVSLCSELLSKYNYRLLTSTTGDNGCAVANACAELQGSLPVTILYSGSRIPLVRYNKLHSIVDNEHRVIAISLPGDFDDCHNSFLRLLIKKEGRYIAANSVNFMYLVPMIAYYAWIATECPDQDIFIPAGTCGELLAALTAKEMGAPIGHIHCTDGPNDYIRQYLRGESKIMQKKDTVSSISAYLDISYPSNLTRIRAMFLTGKNEYTELSNRVTCHSVSDDGNVSTIMRQFSLDTLSAMSCMTSILSAKVSNPVIPIISKQTISSSVSKTFCSAINDYSEISTKRSIILVGMPGAGKSTLCKSLNGIDNDDLIAAEYGPVNDYLISCDSTETFLLSEGVVMRKLLDSINSNEKTGVFATGGSIVHDPFTIDALKNMNDSVMIIWLHTTDKTRGRNMDRGVAWPSGVQSWDELEELRYPLYKEIAHIRLCTDDSISSCINLLNSILCRSPNKKVVCDYSSFSPFRLSISSRSCTPESLGILTDALIDMNYDTKITANTTINDGVVEPGFDILFTALSHSATKELSQLTTRGHAMIIWPRISSLLGLRCAYFEMFGRFCGCIHSFLMTKCPGAYPIR